MLRLEVSDGGTGLASSLASERPGKLHNLGVGISGMRVRLEQLAGKLDIESGPAGTRVSAFVPISAAKPAEIA
jgi:signal transduction histidine kinase